eukprot:jgi/Chlat1/8123/Chrsp75S07580
MHLQGHSNSQLNDVGRKQAQLVSKIPLSCSSAGRPVGFQGSCL